MTDGKNKTKNKNNNSSSNTETRRHCLLRHGVGVHSPACHSLWLVWLAGVRRQGGGDGVWSCDGRHRALPEDRELDGRPGAERGQVDGQMDGECPARDERT